MNYFILQILLNSNFEYQVISQDDFIQSTQKGTISSVDIKKRNNKIIANIMFTGSITPSAGNLTGIFTVKEQYRPKVNQSFACLVNTATSSGQVVLPAVGIIYKSGALDVCFTNTTVHGHSSYPWCTNKGLTISYEL